MSTFELNVDKNTTTVYNFYNEQMYFINKLKNKIVLLFELGNVNYVEAIKKIAKNVCVIDSNFPFEYGFENIENTKKYIKCFLEKIKMPKFDVAIMNPPFNNTLHLQILDKIIDVADITVNISPIEWLNVSEIYFGKNKKIYNSFLEKNKYKCASLYDLSMKDSNIMFGTNFPMKTGVSVWKHDKIYNVLKIKHEDKLSIISKLRKVKNIRNFLTCEKDNTKIEIPVQGDNGYCKCWHYNLEQMLTGTPNAHLLVENNNIKNNIINSIKNCWPYKFQYIIDDYAAIPAHLPFMEDYTKPWTDKRFCEYFGISGYISVTEAEPNSEWETILKTIEEYK